MTASDKQFDMQQRQQQQQEQKDAIERRSAQIRHKLIVMSGKGGVGKSTVAVNLAWTLAAQGAKVGLLDADVHGPNAATMTGTANARIQGSDESTLLPVIAAHGLKIVSIAMLLEDRDTPMIWRGPMRSGVLRQFMADVEWGELDYLVADLPPGTGDEALTIVQSLPDADGVIIVTTPQKVSQEDCRKAINFARKLEIPVIGVIENMSGFVCPNCGALTPIFSQGGGKSMAEEMAVPYLGALPLVPEVVELSDTGIPIGDKAAPTAIREAFAAIVSNITEELD